ncbi:hypothetical protein [Photobacterium leiognathi]|uniref:hypothetical protein n=1 Tax=Photobacterium leiognathi TaxID=553611 RepID=UPI002738AA0A|nr:hypothetical protein [Photobacterium leiognathi]
MKRTYSFLILILMSVSFASNAETTVDSNARTTMCVSQSRITSITVPNNNRIEILFQPARRSASSSAYYNNNVQMWQGGSYLRWKNKLDILRDALLSRKRITVGSRDNNCKGNDDEFYITVFN